MIALHAAIFETFLQTNYSFEDLSKSFGQTLYIHLYANELFSETFEILL